MRRWVWALGIVSWAATALAADWPVFRGNPASTGATTDSLPDTLAIRWKVATGGASPAVESTAAIVGPVVFVGAMDEYLRALDRDSGRELWKTKVGLVKAPVGVHDGAVFVGNLDGLFWCLEAATGKERWKINLESEISSGPNFVGNDVLFGTADEYLICADRAQGSIRWKYQVSGGPVMGTPAIARGRTFVAGCDSTLHVLDLAQGKEIASVSLNGQVGASGAVADDRLYIGTMSNAVQAIDLGKNDIAWTFEPARRKQPFFSSAALTDALLVVGNRDKHVYAIERATGKERWNFATQGKVDSSPVIAGDRVYVGSQDGNLYVLERDTGRLRQKLTLDGPITASPAVSHGMLVIGTEKGTIYGLGAAR